MPYKPKTNIKQTNISTLAIVISIEKSTSNTYETEVKFMDIDSKEYIAKMNCYQKLAIGDIVKIQYNSNNKNVAIFISN